MRIEPINKEAYDLFHEGSIAFAEASHHGMRIDDDYLKDKIDEVDQQIDERTRAFKQSSIWEMWTKIYGDKAKMSSDHQLRVILYDKLHYDITKETDTGLPSVDYETLASMDDDNLRHLIAVNKLTKLRSTYLIGLRRDQVDGWIHPNYNLHLVKTFRSSSDSPNFHNIPKRDAQAKKLVRNGILPRKDHQFISADFSGIEVRVAACYHKDPTMLNYINDLTTDMHRDMAVQLFQLEDFDKGCVADKHLRQAGKNGFVFPQFYGDYYGNNARILIEYANSCPGPLSTGVEILDHMEDLKLIKRNKKGKVVSYKAFTKYVQEVENHFWNKRFGVYKAWKDDLYKRYQRDGYVELLTGFRCSGVMSRNEVTNYPVQGAAFHCLLWAFNRISKISHQENWNSRLVGQIHDDIVLDVAPYEADGVVTTVRNVTCKQLPKAWDWIIVPIDIDVEAAGINRPWAELTDYVKEMP